MLKWRHDPHLRSSHSGPAHVRPEDDAPFYCEYLGCQVDWQEGEGDQPIYLQRRVAISSCTFPRTMATVLQALRSTSKRTMPPVFTVSCTRRITRSSTLASNRTGRDAK
jgi:hypothetical protein